MPDRVRSIRRDIPIPYYYQLMQLLREDIVSGLLAADTPIPSEHTLCATYGISRPVVRQALGELVSEGLLYRVKAKGTYVARRKLTEKFVQRSEGFYGEMTRRGYRVASQILLQRVLQPPSYVLAALGLKEGIAVTVIDRLRSVDDETVVYVRTYIPCDLCPDLVEVDLANLSLYALLHERYGLKLATGTRMVEAVTAQPPLHKLLGVKKGSPLLKIVSTSYLSDGRPLEYYEAWHVGYRCTFELEVVAGPRDRAAGSTTSPINRRVGPGAQEAPVGG